MEPCHDAHALPEVPWPAPVIERAARMFSAAGAPERLRLLARLSGVEACVTAIAEAEGEGLSTISNRLKLLHREGLVARRREGRHVWYRLADDHVDALIRAVIAHAHEPHHPGDPDVL